MDAQTTLVFTFKRVRAPSRIPHARVYDYDVLVDGERIATWKRDAGRGYVLRDVGGEQVRDPKWPLVIPMAMHTDFSQAMARWFEHIPTAEQVAVRQQERTEKAAAWERFIAERTRIERIQQAGPSLLDALKAMVIAYREAETPEQEDAHSLASCAMLEALLPEGEDGGM